MDDQAVAASNGKDTAGQLWHIDVGDFLHHLCERPILSGVQRVQMELTAALMERREIALIARDGREARWRKVSTTAYLAILDGLNGGSGRDIRVEAARALENLGSTCIPHGSLIVNVGVPCWTADYYRLIATARASRKIQFAAFVHDLIPIKLPGRCSPALTGAFTAWAYLTVRHADYLIVNSNATAHDLVTFAERFGRTVQPIVLRLDGLSRNLCASCPPSTLAILDASSQPYALFVGTIESRKRHDVVFDAWAELCRQLPAVRIPTLVCVGRRGYLADEMLAIVKNDPVLRRKVCILEAVPDGELAHLYQSAAFTIYNSMDEGWGLPITEALRFGRIPIASDLPAHREAGGDFALYFDPTNRNALVEIIVELLMNESIKSDREAVIKSDVRLTAWTEIAGRLERLLEENRSSMEFHRETIDLGRRYPFGHQTGPKPDPARIAMQIAAHGADWSVPEYWGRWTTALVARVTLPLPQTTGDICLYLELQAPIVPIRFRIGVGREATAMLDPADGLNVLIRIPKVVISDLDLEVAIMNEALIELAPLTGGADSRTIGMAVKSIMICESSDHSSRLDYVETYGRFAVATLSLGERDVDL